MVAPNLDALAAELGGQPVQSAAPDIDALAAEFGGTPVTQEPVRMDRKAFNAELLRRVRETDESPEQIREWARSVRQPAQENATDLAYDLTDRAAEEIAAIRGRANVPAQVIDIGERNTGLGPIVRGGADALLFNRGDELTAGLNTGFGLAGNYDEALQEERLLRAQDDPTDRFFGQMGTAALSTIGPGLPGAVGKVLGAVPAWVAAPTSIVGRAGRAAVAGAGSGALYSSGALTGDETLGKATTETAIGAGQGLLTAGILSPAIDLTAAGGRRVVDLFSGRSGATSALETIAKDVAQAFPTEFAALRQQTGRDPSFADVMRLRFTNLQQQLGRQPSMGEVLGPQGARLTDTLSAAPENAARFSEAVQGGVDTLQAGVRQRRGARDYVAEEEAAALAGVRGRVGGGEIIDTLDQQLLAGNRELLGDAQFAERQRQALLATLRRDLPVGLPQQELNAMQREVQQQIAGLDARGPLALRQAQKELDDANYAALREVSTPVDPKDVSQVNKFLASVNIEGRTKTEIRDMLNKSKMITGDAYEKIRRGLRDRWLSGQIGSETYRADAEKLDQIFGPYLPQVGQARQASFEARSATEGSALGMKAVGGTGQGKPATMAEALDVATPEQMAGVPSGAVQEVRNQTRTADSTYALATQVVSNAQYAANLKRALPGGMADGLISFLTNSKRSVDRASDLAMDKATANGKAAYDFAERLQDPRFAQEFRDAAPDIADGVIAEATRQKAKVDALESLNLPKAVESVSSARKFAERVAEDSQFRQTLERVLPPNISGALIEGMTSVGGLAGRLEAAGIRTAGNDASAAEAFLNRIATDDKFAAGLVRDLPKEVGEGLIDFAKTQKARIDAARNAGLDKVARNPAESYRFAERMRDPVEQDELRRVAPDIADDLIQYVQGQKQAIDSLAALSGMRPEQVATNLDTLEEITKAGFFQTTGGAGKAGFLARMSRETFGIGKDAARKLADDLLDPAKFEPAMRLLEKRGVTRDRINRIARDSIIAAMSGNTETPEGAISTRAAQE